MEKLTFDTKAGLSLQIESTVFPVSIIGDTVEETTFIIDSDEPIDLNDICTTEFKAEENFLSIHIKENRHKHIHFKIITHHEIELSAKNENASIYLKDLNGTLSIQSENGKTHIAQCSGTITSKNENGKSLIQETNGTLEITTENGAVHISKCQGNAAVISENGSIRVIESPFSHLSVRNDNGSIYSVFPEIEQGTYEFRNENGKIQLILPTEVPYSIRAEIEQGSFHNSLSASFQHASDADIQIFTTRHLSGKVHIDIRNEQGSIHLLPPQLRNKAQTKISLEKLSEKIESLMSNFADQISKKKLNKSMEKVKQAIEKIPDDCYASQVEHKISTAIDQIKNQFTASSETAGKNSDTEKQDIEDVINDVTASLSETPIENAAETPTHRILKMIEEKKITADEGVKLLNALEKK